MTRINRGLVIPAVVLFPLWLAGCQDAAGGAPKPLTPNPHPYISDVPLPKGFKIVDKRSEDRMSGGIRFVRHEYKGRAHPISVRNFFREQMPLSRWTQLNDVNTKGLYTITLEKEGENCIIEIESRSVLGIRETFIRVTISKIDRSTSPPANQGGRNETVKTARSENQRTR